MATLFFHKQCKTYYTRAYIPRKLRCLLRSRVELWRSLDTTDADVAALRSAQWDARLHRVFLTLKREGRYVTQAQIDALVERWLESALEEAEDHLATCSHGYHPKPKCSLPYRRGVFTFANLSLP